MHGLIRGSVTKDRSDQILVQCYPPLSREECLAYGVLETLGAIYALMLYRH
jgi:hypothetical protein